jgi:hypothetical protein
VTITAANVTFTPAMADAYLWAQRRSADSSAFSGETQVLSTPVMYLAPNTAYRITYQYRGTATVTGDHFRVLLYVNSLSGTIVSEDEVVPVTDNGGTGWVNAFLTGFYTTTAAENSKFVASALRLTGTGTTTARVIGCSLLVEQMGPSSLVTQIP